MITILAEVARMERKTIKERMESGYNNFRANNGKVGRKIGYRKSEEQFLEQYKDVIRLLKKGVKSTRHKQCNRYICEYYQKMQDFYITPFYY